MDVLLFSFILATDPSGYFSLSDLANPFAKSNPIGTHSPLFTIITAAGLGLNPYADYNILQQHDRFFMRNPDLQWIPKVVVPIIVGYFTEDAELTALAAGAVDAHFTRINGGDLGDIGKSFVVGFATSYLSSMASGISNPAYRTVAFAGIGCASAVANGGNCGQGALSSAFSAAYNSSGVGGGPVGAAIAGGVGAKLGGGDFWQGAKAAGLGYLVGSALRGDFSDGKLIEDTATGLQAIAVDIYAVVVGQVGAVWAFGEDLSSVGCLYSNVISLLRERVY